MTKITKIIIGLLLLLVIGMMIYGISIQDKVKAGDDLLKSQARLNELNDLIEDAKFRYSIAEQSKQECIDSWNKEREKAHDDAEKYRIEKSEIEGFLLDR